MAKNVSSLPTTDDPTALRTRELARLDQQVVDLDDELRKLLALVQFSREALQNQMTDGMGYKKMVILEKDLKALKELSTIFSVATDCQVRLDKTQEIRSKKLDKNGYLRLALKLVMSLSDAERGHWISDLLVLHRGKAATGPNVRGVHKIDDLIERFKAENPEAIDGEAGPEVAPDGDSNPA